jgi:hypothetical protein
VELVSFVPAVPVLPLVPVVGCIVPVEPELPVLPGVVLCASAPLASTVAAKRRINFIVLLPGRIWPAPERPNIALVPTADQQIRSRTNVRLGAEPNQVRFVATATMRLLIERYEQQ